MVHDFAGRAAKATEVATAAAAAQWQCPAGEQPPELAQSPDPDALAMRLLAIEATTQRAAAPEGSPSTQYRSSPQLTPFSQRTLISQVCTPCSFTVRHSRRKSVVG